MNREEALSEWTFRSNHIKKWLDENGEEPSIRHYVELIDMAIEAMNREQKKYDAICDELLKLKSDLNLPIEVAIAYEKSIGVVRKYAKMGGTT